MVVIKIQKNKSKKKIPVVESVDYQLIQMTM